MINQNARRAPVAGVIARALGTLGATKSGMDSRRLMGFFLGPGRPAK